MPAGRGDGLSRRHHSSFYDLTIQQPEFEDVHSIILYRWRFANPAAQFFCAKYP